MDEGKIESLQRLGKSCCYRCKYKRDCCNKTNERRDGKMPKPLMEIVERNVGKGKIRRVTADGTYDIKRTLNI